MKKSAKNYSENSAKILAASFFILVPLSVFAGLSSAPLLIFVSLTVTLLSFRHLNIISYTEKNFFIMSLLAVFFLWALLSLAWTVDSKHAFFTWIRVGLLFDAAFLLLCFINIMNKKQAGRVAEAIFIGSAFGLALFLFQKITGGAVVEFFKHHIEGKEGYNYKLEETNRGIATMVLSFFPALLITLKKEKRLAVFFTIITAFVVFSLKSLSAKNGLMVGLSAFLFMYFTRAKYINIITAAVVVFSATGLWLISTLSTENISSLTSLPQSSMHRLFIWDFVYDRIMEKPVLGWGFDSSSLIPGGKDIINNSLGWTKLPLHPHNNILQVFLELGAVGLVLFFVFFIAIMNLIKNSQLGYVEKSASVALSVSYFTISLSGFGIWQFWWVSSILLATSFLFVAYKMPSKA